MKKCSKNISNMQVQNENLIFDVQFKFCNTGMNFFLDHLFKKLIIVDIYVNIKPCKIL